MNNSNYTHRPLHTTSTALQSAPGGGASNPRIADLLEFVRQEFDVVANDAHAIKAQNNEFETHTHQHIKEMQALRHNFLDLEREHQKAKEQYEEEIIRLRRELESAQQAQHSGSSASHPPQHSLPPLQQPHQQQQSSHLPLRENRTGSGSAPAPPQVGHGPANLFGGIMGGSGQGLNGPQSASATTQREFPPMTTDAHMPASAREQYTNGWDRERREREHADAPPAKRMRNDEPGPPASARDAGHYPGTPSSAYGLNKSGNASTAQAPQSMGFAKAAMPASMQQPSSHPPTPSSEMTPDTLPKENKKEGSDWVTMYNPKVKKTLDVELVHTLMHDSVVCCVRFSPNGKVLATGCNRNTNLYDTKTGAKQCILAEDTPGPKEDNYIRAACFSPDGNFIATGSEDRTIRIWDIAAKRVRHAFHGHRSEIYSLAFSPDGRFLMSGSGDKSARVWDMDTGGERYNLAVEDQPAEGAPVDAGVTSVAVSPDGKLLAAGSLDTIVRLWDATTGVLLDKLRGHRDSVYSVAFSPDGQWLVSGSLDKTLKIWNLLPLKAVLASGGSGAGVTSSTPGNGAASAEGETKKDGEATASKPEESTAVTTCMSTLTGHKDYVLSVAVSPDGNWIVSGSKDRGVSFWDPKATSAAVVLQGHKNSVISIAVSEAIAEGGSGLLATGSGDWSCRIWKYSPIK